MVKKINGGLEPLPWLLQLPSAREQWTCVLLPPMPRQTESRDVSVVKGQDPSLTAAQDSSGLLALSGERTTEVTCNPGTAKAVCFLNLCTSFKLKMFFLKVPYKWRCSWTSLGCDWSSQLIEQVRWCCCLPMRRAQVYLLDWGPSVWSWRVLLMHS